MQSAGRKGGIAHQQQIAIAQGFFQFAGGETEASLRRKAQRNGFDAGLFQRVPVGRRTGNGHERAFYAGSGGQQRKQFFFSVRDSDLRHGGAMAQADHLAQSGKIVVARRAVCVLQARHERRTHGFGHSQRICQSAEIDQVFHGALPLSA